MNDLIELVKKLDPEATLREERWDFGNKIELSVISLMPYPVKCISNSMSINPGIYEESHPCHLVRFKERSVRKLVAKHIKDKVDTYYKLNNDWIWNPNRFILEHPNKIVRTINRFQSWLGRYFNYYKWT
jgi:hypothetical protein